MGGTSGCKERNGYFFHIINFKAPVLIVIKICLSGYNLLHV